MTSDLKGDSTTKRCRRCREIKPETEFFRRGRFAVGLRSHCKSCHNKARSPESPWQSRSVSLRLRGLPSPGIPALREALGEPQTCYLCGSNSLDWKTAVIDHIMPMARGGTNAPANLGWTHNSCNKLKANRTLPELVTLLKSIIRFQEHLGR